MKKQNDIKKLSLKKIKITKISKPSTIQIKGGGGGNGNCSQIVSVETLTIG